MKRKISSIYLQFLIFLIIIVNTTCTKSDYLGTDESDFSDGSGTGGSMARFTICNGYLYTVDVDSLNVFDISTPSSPVFKRSFYPGIFSTLETIFPADTLLFIGSTLGMFIYDVSVPEYPVKISEYEHIRSCDPVVVEGDYAYITLRSDNSLCNNITNEFQIINISNIQSPYLVKRIELTSPKGLAVDNGKLFICDDGLKVFDVSNVSQTKLIEYYEITCNDIIILGGKVLLIGDNGFYQYRYDGSSMQLISQLTINN